MDLDLVKQVKEHANKENSGVVVLCAKLEEELAALEEDEKAAFIEELGLEKAVPGQACAGKLFSLNLISFLTAGEKESRAWRIKRNKGAPSGGKIHTDFERGFIRAEVIEYQKLMECGSLAAA